MTRLLTNDEYANAVVVVDSDGNMVGGIQPTGLSTVACGELQGSVTTLQMPSVACKYARFKGALSNAGNVYIGGAGVTKPNGTTDITTGLELSAGDDTGWLPVSNLNIFYRICDNAGDDLTYMVLT